MKQRGFRFVFTLALVLFFSLSFISAGQLKVTEEHPFLVGDSWVPASELQVGDLLKSPDGKTIRVTSLEDVVSPTVFPVFDFEVLGYHNFVVGSNDENVVVHNSAGIKKYPSFFIAPKKKLPSWTNDEWYQYLLSKSSKIKPSVEMPKKFVVVGEQITHEEAGTVIQGGGGAVFMEVGSNGKRVVKVSRIDMLVWRDAERTIPARIGDGANPAPIVNIAEDLELYYLREIENMKLADRLGLRKFYGEVEVTNVNTLRDTSKYARNDNLLSTRAYTMDYVEGAWASEARNAGYFNGETLADALAKYRKLYDAGYVQSDFQFLVTKNGKAEIIDWGSVVPKGSTPWSKVEQLIQEELRP